jgi:hypothetical protein
MATAAKQPTLPERTDGKEILGGKERVAAL